MKYYDPFIAVENKLYELLAEHGLVATWKKQEHPLKLVITPDASPEAQMSLLGDEEGTTSPDARLCYTFDLDDINVELDGRLAIPDSLMNKIKGLAKKMHYEWLKGYFAESKANGEDEDNDIKADEPTEGDASGESKDFDGFFSDDKSGESSEPEE